MEILLESLPIQFDILSLTETWHSKTKLHLFEAGLLCGYRSYIGQAGTSLKSGCGFYISNHLKFVPRKDLDVHFCNENNEFEAKWVEIININQPNTVIASIYRHPSNTDLSFIDYIKTTLEKIDKEQKLVIMTGDFNMNLINHKQNKLTNEFLEIMFSHFYQPHIIYPTRVVDNAEPSLLDNIFMNNNNEYNPISGNITDKISDHMPNFLILQNFQKSPNTNKLQKRDYSNFDGDNFLSELNSDIVQANILNSNSTNDKYNIFHDHLLTTLNKHIPIKLLSKKELKLKLKPWLTSGILTSVKRKNYFYKKFVKSQNPFWYSKYKTYRDKLNHLIRTSKNTYYKNNFNTFKSNSKKIWSGINELLHKKHSSKNNTINLHINGEIITNEKNVANKLMMMVITSPRPSPLSPPSLEIYDRIMLSPRRGGNPSDFSKAKTNNRSTSLEQ